jgi:anthranilate phosphoribosyltransferase
MSSMDIQKAIAALIDKRNMSRAEMEAAMRQIMTGNATDAQIAGFLIALRMKGETVDEIAGAASVMRELATPVTINADYLVDIVGTGGDGSSLFNVSTASCFVVAAAGGLVAKHGNRSVSSKSGAADLLETAGVRLDLSPEQVARCVEEHGVGFLFAVNHHSAMKHAITARKELAVRTVFNLLGPLTNPAGVKRQVLGVYSRDWLRPVAEVLKALGSDHALVVHSEDGLDEISIAATTYVAELKNGAISEYTITPEDFGFARASLDSLKVADSSESLALIRKALKRKAEGAATQMIALNAGAAIYVAGLAQTLVDGIRTAHDVLATGTALEKLDELAEMTRVMKEH